MLREPGTVPPGSPVQQGGDNCYHRVPCEGNRQCSGERRKRHGSVHRYNGHKWYRTVKMPHYPLHREEGCDKDTDIEKCSRQPMDSLRGHPYPVNLRAVKVNGNNYPEGIGTERHQVSRCQADAEPGEFCPRSLQTGNEGKKDGREANYQEIDPRACGGDDNAPGMTDETGVVFPIEINSAKERDQT